MQALIKRLSYAGFLFALGLGAAGAVDNPATPSGWPSFRGWFAGGIAEGYRTPVQWNVEANQNIEWKTQVPGLGHSSPVVFEDRVFATTAISDDGKSALKVGLYGDVTPVEETAAYSWKVFCLDRKTGLIIWERMAHTKDSPNKLPFGPSVLLSGRPEDC